MLINILLLISNCILRTTAYTNLMFTLTHLKDPNPREINCLQYEQFSSLKAKTIRDDPRQLLTRTTSSITTPTTVETDPLNDFQSIMHNFLFGSETIYKGEETDDEENDRGSVDKPIPYHYPNGNVLRAELFQNKSGVHLPMAEYLHRSHCLLNITMDFMQTAVNAFAIFLDGNINDILRLPSSYVLHSARSISMMKIAREKLVATWSVVKGAKQPEEIKFQTLELYRPLFKYLNGKEISKLNLTDNRILTYIGTHADLDRHQVGVVASRYIKLNKNWSEPKYLNTMNNLLCGVPMTLMRRIPENTYLQLSHQVFYHIHACDPLQRRFYLAMMTKTQALGKSYSWNARDVSRLGLLLAEVEGPELSAINPEAIAGITAHVMEIMTPQNLQHFTETQLKFMGQKPLNILARKVKFHEDEQKIYNSEYKARSAVTLPITLLFFSLK